MRHTRGMRRRHSNGLSDVANGGGAGAGVEALETRQLLSVVNGGFEAGDVSGWASVQSQYFDRASVVASHPATGGPTYLPVEGSAFALLPAANGGRPTAISQDFHAQVGDVISGWAFYDNGNTADQNSFTDRVATDKASRPSASACTASASRTIGLICRVSS